MGLRGRRPVAYTISIVCVFAVNMILYIIADNNDIALNSEQAFITHRTPQKLRDNGTSLPK